jgi:hypothetical protein
MGIYDLFNELDYIISHHFGDLDAALATERGTTLVTELLAEKNRDALREWYASAGSLNLGAKAVKDKLEDLSKERFWPPPPEPSKDPSGEPGRSLPGASAAGE